MSLDDKHTDFLSKSIYISELCELVKELMERYNIFLGKNTIVVIITCLDDQCTTVIEYIKRELRKFQPTKFNYDTHEVHLEKFYSMRLFGGLFIPKIKTYECLLPAAHHIPNKEDGNLLIFNFTHIGYDSDTNEFGTLVRHGHSKHTAACGAIISCYEKIRQGSRLPRDNDLKILGKYLKGLVSKFNIEYDHAGQHLLELTLHAYEMQMPWLKYQLTELALLDNINIIYIGGVEVDFSKSCEEFAKDKIVVMDKFYIDKQGSFVHL